MTKISKLATAKKIVETQQAVVCLEEILSNYSNKGLDGKRWSISKVNDSRHFDARRMLQLLSEEDQRAINNYVVKKTRAAINKGKRDLKDMGISEL